MIGMGLISRTRRIAAVFQWATGFLAVLDVVPGQLLQDLLRRHRVPALVGVDAQQHLVAGSLADGLDPGHIIGHVGAQLDLDGREAPGHHAHRLLGHGLRLIEANSSSVKKDRLPPPSRA